MKKTNEQLTNVPAIRNFQFDPAGLGSIKDSVNLFRGDVNLPLNLISLTGRNGLDVNVSVIYESNVQNSIDTWNLEAPTIGNKLSLYRSCQGDFRRCFQEKLVRALLFVICV